MGIGDNQAAPWRVAAITGEFDMDQNAWETKTTADAPYQQARSAIREV
jgi:hypothetical protein